LSPFWQAVTSQFYVFALNIIRTETLGDSKMALSSPGVEVKVIDESFYTPAEPGTVPLIIVASAENKANGGGTGTAPGTLKANAGEVYLLTSQRDLADNFGDPIFKTDASGNPVHAGEQNEYGLQAAYSLLGVSNRAFVVRADINLDQLTPVADEPTSNPANGTHWFNSGTSAYGLFQWNSAPITSTGGQTFSNKVPLVVTDSTKVNTLNGAPKASVGAIGDYAWVVVDTDVNTPSLTTSHPNKLWYKSKGTAPGQSPGQWVEVGTNDYAYAFPTVAGTAAPGSLIGADTITINGTAITGNTSVTALVTAINGANITGVKAARVNGKLELYANASAQYAGLVITGTGSILASLGITGGSSLQYHCPQLYISKHTDVPVWGSTSTNVYSTGSLWLKTTEPNLGSRYRFNRWNSSTVSWDSLNGYLYTTGHQAIYNLDKAGGGKNVPVGTLYVQTNYSETNTTWTDVTSTTIVRPALAKWKAWRRGAAGETTVTGTKISAGSVAAGAKTITIQESIANQAALNSAVSVNWTAAGTSSDADALAAAINAAGFTNVVASVDNDKVTITHTAGGEIRIGDASGVLASYGFIPYDYEPSSANFATGTRYFFDAPQANNYIVSNWEPLVYVASSIAPSRIPEDGQLWYSSVIDEVDILVHDGDTWVGYKNQLPTTDPMGPQVSATAPETQSDGTDLVTGDLWISTADLENFPTIYKYNASLANVPVASRWVEVDKTDQTTQDGVLFADARYNTAGANSDVAGDIVDLLESDYLDPDAPDPALYPRGMLLWNLRRSGYNVKQFKRGYINPADDNERNNNEAMEDYYVNRWITVSSNQDDGSGSFGHKAQRKVIVKALQAVVNSNDAIRDEERRVFNLIACPGYPELIGEMISLNYDRGLTAFVVGDTPARLTPDATSLLAWASNENGANEDNDIGAVSFDEYMGMFYPWGFTSDNFGNNVVVPPSHMILRTIALSDAVSYPWFAPAGVRRGGITNATAVGYISSEGEFKSVALNVGQRDTLYEQKVNPITFLTGTGLVNYGQKTRARAASALDRINVARLVCYLRRQLNALAKPYIFEPNDKITRDEVKAAVEALMLELVGQRAIYDYLVVCDESNNTPNRIDRNELWIDIAIEPVKAVEFIYIPLRLKNTGEIKALG
jgi:hypothetical protein